MRNADSAIPGPLLRVTALLSTPPMELREPFQAWRRKHGWPVAGLIILAVAANLPALSGLFDTDPTLTFSGLGTGVRAFWLDDPRGWMDPAVGLYSQPLGQLAMRDWLQGIVPWWNPYSGLGMKLAAEMNAPVFFFPFNIVMLSDNGWLWMRLLLQALAGMLAYALCIELGLARLAAFLGGGLYALSPEFILAPHSAIAPLPFLPLLLLGVERAAKGRRGWMHIAAGIAWSITAGFPEVALFNGLLVALWSVYRGIRLRGLLLLRLCLQLAAGLAIGVAITAPLLLPFLDYTRNSIMGAHNSDLLANMVVATGLRAMQVLPFAFGLLGQPAPAAAAAYFDYSWVRLPGWIDLQVLLFSIAAFWRPRRALALRWWLLAWVLVWELRYAGIPPFVALINALPFLNQTDYIRFTGPSVDFALFVLAAFGFDDYLRQAPLSGKRLAGVFLCLFGILALLVGPAIQFFGLWYGAVPKSWHFGLLTLAFGVLMLGLCAAELRRRRHPGLLAAALLGGMVCELAGAQLGAQGGHLDLAPVRYLQSHIGLARMASLGALGWNFNLPYGIASITYASMPAPILMSDEVVHHLLTFDPNDFKLDDPAIDTNINYILPRLAADGVRYVVAPAGSDWRQTQDAAVLAPGSAMQPVLLSQADHFVFFISYNAPQRIKGFSLLAALPPGQAQTISAVVCIRPQCTNAQARITGGKAASWLEFDFPKPLAVTNDFHALAIAMKQSGGAPVSIWAGKDAWGNPAPDLRVLAARPQSDVSEVFNDGNVAIYELADTAAYAQASNPLCSLTILSRTHIRTQCPGPAELTRLEMFDPGWHASVNGVEASVTLADGRFQAVAVPAGAADITFHYQPPHILLASMLALSAAILWVFLAMLEFLQSRMRMTRSVNVTL
jgi:hypothetical protein